MDEVGEVWEGGQRIEERSQNQKKAEVAAVS